MKLLTIVLSLFMLIASGIYASDKCVGCASGSSCQQCKLDGGVDNLKNRKKCEQLGCKITGTGPCSTASNVKVCNR
ncbi:MAG: hypothetical protein N3A69_10005 [Leptospiraceae bacterium]|nr:hypothetical protein [Leptospiraceae bacterium]